MAGTVNGVLGPCAAEPGSAQPATAPTAMVAEVLKSERRSMSGFSIVKVKGWMWPMPMNAYDCL